MRVYYFGTNEGDHHPHDTEGQLHDLQFLVGGFIEAVYLPEFTQYGIILLVNEEGLLAHLEPNANLFPYFLVGNVIALSSKGEEFVGLDAGQEEFIKEWLKANA